MHEKVIRTNNSSGFNNSGDADLKAIILAAGQGSRLNAGIPKSLIELGEKTILDRQISQLQRWSIHDISIVIGHGGVWSPENQGIVRQLGKTVVVNEDSLDSQSTYSLELALESVGDDAPVIIIDGDLVLSGEVLNALTMLEDETAIIVKQGYGSSLELERKGKDGYLLKSVGSYRDSDTIYAGIMRLDKSHIKLFRQTLPLFKASIMGDFLSEACQGIPIRAIRLLESNEGSEFVEIADMHGGSYARTNKIAKEDGLVLRKEILATGKDKLADEINLLLNLDNGIKQHFPQVTAYHLNDKPDYMELKFYPMATLRQELLSEKLSLDEATGFIDKLLDFVFKKFADTNVAEVPDNYVETNYLFKTLARLSEAGKLSNKINILNQQNVLVINGKKYINILPLLRHMKHYGKTFVDSVSPARLNLIHGDLHFDNILYGDPFILVDPRGWKSGDIAYDLGKLLHSCHGLYDFLHEGKFNLSKEGDDFIFDVEDSPARKLYDKIHEWLAAQLDDRLRLRAYFAEAMHFSSVIPFHLSNEKLAIACYLTGVKQFNAIYKIDEKELDIAGKIININKTNDYKEALAVFEDSGNWS